MGHIISVQFDEGMQSADPEEREAALIRAVLVLTEQAAIAAGLAPCPVFSTLAAAAVALMVENGHVACAAATAEEIGTGVATVQRHEGRRADA